MARTLHFLHHTFRPERYEVFEGMSIGSSEAESDVCFISEGVGNPHCRFLLEQKKVSIIDLNSGHPTYIRSKKLRPYIPYDLSEGDLLQIGRENLVYSQAFTLDPGHSYENLKGFIPGLKEQFGLSFSYCLALIFAITFFVRQTTSVIWPGVLFALFSLGLVLLAYFWGERKVFSLFRLPLWNRWAMRLLIVPLWAWVLSTGGTYFRHTTAQDLQAAAQEKVDWPERLPASTKETP